MGDFTIVAGDSTGKVSFFNGIHGNLLQVFQANKADVLTLCLNEEENKLFCGGVEPGISQFEKVIAGPGNDSFHRDYQKWVPSLPRLLHTHDVKSLCMAGEFLVSGGVDTNLGLSKYPPKTYITLPHIPKNSVHLAEKAACLMLQYADYLEVWKLGDTAVELEMGVEGGDGEMLPLTKGAKKLLQLKTRNDERVICSAISRDARWLAYSHTSAIHLYQLSLDEEKPLSVHRVKYLPPGVQPAHHLCFAGSDRLLVATETGDVQVLEVDSVKPKLLHNFDGCQEAVSHIRASNCGRYAAVSNFSRTVIVYDIIEFKKVCAMPQFPQQVAALCFHPRDLELLVVYADNSVVEYSIAEKGYTSWSRRYAKMRHQMEPAEHVGTTLNVMYHPSDEKHSQLILHGDKRVRCIDKTEVQSRKRGGALHVCDRIHYLVHVAPSAPDWLVIVERTPQSIAVTLPPTLAVKKFGT
ncbi:PREDICTED: cirhin-like [Priapulus caudatus]|uniref:Cirhin-like n=1 Tax=Priapulus caudatus TaxID=37621 RepID=A0ABM1F1P1_PRICU|nr:PREDICTED: cirhin-like [Priapulus caudatus]